MSSCLGRNISDTGGRLQLFEATFQDKLDKLNTLDKLESKLDLLPIIRHDINSSQLSTQN